MINVEVNRALQKQVPKTCFCNARLSFTHFQSCKLQAKAYWWNDEKTKQDL